MPLPAHGYHLVVLCGIRPATEKHEHAFGVAMRESRVEGPVVLHGATCRVREKRGARVCDEGIDHVVHEALRKLFDHAVFGVRAYAVCGGRIFMCLQNLVVLQFDAVIDHRTDRS